jgi:hypothetical protein
VPTADQKIIFSARELEMRLRQPNASDHYATCRKNKRRTGGLVRELEMETGLDHEMRSDESLKSQKPSHKTSDLLVKVLEMSMQPLDIVSLEASDHKPSYLRASQKTSDLWS